MVSLNFRISLAPHMKYNVVIVLRIFNYNDWLLRGSLSIKGEVERRKELVGMFGISLSAGRRGGQHIDGSRTMPAPVSAELQIGRKRW